MKPDCEIGRPIAEHARQCQKRDGPLAIIRSQWRFRFAQLQTNPERGEMRISMRRRDDGQFRWLN